MYFIKAIRAYYLSLFCNRFICFHCKLLFFFNTFAIQRSQMKALLYQISWFVIYPSLFPLIISVPAWLPPVMSCQCRPSLSSGSSLPSLCVKEICSPYLSGGALANCCLLLACTTTPARSWLEPLYPWYKSTLCLDQDGLFLFCVGCFDLMSYCIFFGQLYYPPGI